jgi:dihydrofolate reductase
VAVVYSIGVSLDGFVAGPGGDIGWAAPDAELHAFHNEQTAELGAHLCGRRLYETMLPWEGEDLLGSPSEEVRAFARLWQALPKVVFSRTLTGVEGNARLATAGPAEEVARLGAPRGGDVAVGGAGLAATFAVLDLIDEYRLFVSPVVLGGGTPYFPSLSRRMDLELIETRTFGSRVVYLRYRRP